MAKVAGLLTVVNALGVAFMLLMLKSTFHASAQPSEESGIRYTFGALAIVFAANAVCFFRVAISRS